MTASQLVDKQVINSNSTDKLGKISDLIVEPTLGILSGLTIKSINGQDFSFDWQSIVLDEDEVYVQNDFINQANHTGQSGSVKVFGELAGASIVTEQGKLIGHVRDLFFQLDDLKIFYKISIPGWRQMLRHEYFLEGNLPYAYSRICNRLIVPASVVIQSLPPSNLKLQALDKNKIKKFGMAEQRLNLENQQHG